jgi:TonB family protein
MPSANPVSPSSQAGRRFHARRRMDGLAYVEFGTDNGAILIDLGEGGLGFQSVMPVSLNQALLFKFKLPGESNHIEGYAEVAWMNDSRKGGGLRFVELNADAHAQIREWSGVLRTPETGARKAPTGTDASPAQESASEKVPVHSVQESKAPEATQGGDVPAQDSDTFVFSESEEIAGFSPAAEEALPADEAVEQVSADQGALPEVLPVPEFTVAATTSPSFAERLAGQVEWAAPEAPPIASDQPRTTARPEATAAASATAAKISRVPEPDAKKLVTVQKRQRTPAALQESPAAAPYVQDSPLRESFVRPPRKPAPASMKWNAPQAGQEGEWEPQATLASQALRMGIGAAAGACLVLALVFGVSFLRTRVQATANAKASASNLSNLPAFQLEVADLNNRRWILKSGGDAGSPFGDASSRRETQAAAAAAARGESTKSARADDSSDSSTAVNTPKSKLPKPSELALARPHTSPAAVNSAQMLAPSIFDGITPPIGSVTDRLAAGGPDLPGIVPSENPTGLRTSALQSAVLEKRVAPVYPNVALQSHLEGEVLVNATIGQDGIPKNLKVVRGSELLAPAALEAIRQWHYRPATLGGQPIETEIVITINFALK